MAEPSDMIVPLLRDNWRALFAGSLAGKLLTGECEEPIEMLGRKVKELEARP